MCYHYHNAFMGLKYMLEQFCMLLVRVNPSPIWLLTFDLCWFSPIVLFHSYGKTFGSFLFYAPIGRGITKTFTWPAGRAIAPAQ